MLHHLLSYSIQDRRTGIEVIGVTSPRNHAFTHALGCYDEVIAYDDVAAIPRSAPIVSIDMAAAALCWHRSTRTSVTSCDIRWPSAAAITRLLRAYPACRPKPEFFFARRRSGSVCRTGVRAATRSESSRRSVASSRGVPVGCTCSNRAAPRPRRRPGAKSMQAGWRPNMGHMVSLWD